MRRSIIALPFMSLWLLLAACQTALVTPSPTVNIPPALSLPPAAVPTPADLNQALRQMQLDKYISHFHGGRLNDAGFRCAYCC